MLLGDPALVGLSAIGAFTLMQYEMGDIEFDFWQFKHLVRVEWCSVIKTGATAVAAFLGLAILGVSRLKKLLPVPFVAGLRPRLLAPVFILLFLGLLAIFILVWVVGRGRLAGVG